VPKTSSSGSAPASPLAVLQDSINQKFGAGSLMRMEGDEAVPVERITTGSVGLDAATGGGYPRGRVIEIYGPESSGKTSLALSAIAQVQRAGGHAAFIDAEHALFPEWAQKLGVHPPDLLINQPDNGEQALEIADMAAKSGLFDLLVIDSVAALVPRAELEGEMGDSHVGLQARLMSQALRKLTGSLSRSRTTVIFINQLREKIGIMFGNPETTAGGKALKFYASIRLDVRRIESLKDGAEFLGNKVRVKVVKNKTAAPFRTAEFDILFASGINRLGELVDLGIKHRLVVKSGAWYSLNGAQIGQGRHNSCLWLASHPAEAAALEAQVLACLAGSAPVIPIAPAVPESLVSATAEGTPFA
jgi:recombination protein RecA